MRDILFQESIHFTRMEFADMPTAEAARLVKLIQDRIGVLREVCKGIDEATASRAPEGHWYAGNPEGARQEVAFTTAGGKRP
jgi:hypothetical protein